MRRSPLSGSVEFEPARFAGPRAYLVAHGEQREVLAVVVTDDIECRVHQRRDAERGSGADQGGSDVEVALRTRESSVPRLQ